MDERMSERCRGTGVAWNGTRATGSCAREPDAGLGREARWEEGKGKRLGCGAAGGTETNTERARGSHLREKEGLGRMIGFLEACLWS